jgi:glycine/D-amino acid oxidase-like deaminating enzyme
VEDFEVLKLKKSGTSVEVVGKRGKLKAEMAVIATNGYAPILDSFFQQLIFPVRGQMCWAKRYSTLISAMIIFGKRLIAI